MERQMLQQACATTCAGCLLEDFSRRLYHYINEVEWLTVSSAFSACCYRCGWPNNRACAWSCPPASANWLPTRASAPKPEPARRWRQAREWLSGERRHWTLLDTTPLRRLAGALVRTF
jgi:hypothetical protein